MVAHPPATNHAAPQSQSPPLPDANFNNIPGRDNQDDAEHNVTLGEGNVMCREDNAAHGAYKLYHPIIDGQSYKSEPCDINGNNLPPHTLSSPYMAPDGVSLDPDHWDPFKDHTSFKMAEFLF